jgi:RNA polymerase sigma-70 factor (ECF subfamily)
VDADLEQRFVAFVAAYRDRAVGLAGRLLGGELGAAEDVAQEAFVKAYRGLERFREESSLATWFYRILLNEVNRHRRWRAVRRRFAADWPDDLPDRRDPSANPDPALRRRVARALDRLSRGQREAFVMVHLEGFTVAQVAELTGRATGTIKAHLHRALRALRAELADLRPGEGRVES